MFGASAVRKKREREKREKLARGLDPVVFPYIRPFGPCFRPADLPYFRRQAAHAQQEERAGALRGEVGGPRLGHRAAL
jgi:hypothetical protein